MLGLVRTGASVLTAACLVVGLAACSSSDDARTSASAIGSASVRVAEDAEGGPGAAEHAALERYAEKERATLTAHGMFKDTYSSIKVDVIDPGTIEFTYVYIKELDPAKTAAFLDGKVPTLQSTFDTTVSPAMKATGVTSERKMVDTFVNADGSRLWTHTFE